jgi:hypothetical protein
MNIVIVYVYAPESAATPGGQNCDHYLQRFLESYHFNPPGMEHATAIVLNGIKATSEITCLFSSLQNCQFLEHDNSGYDIGAFQLAARMLPCDLMVFFGASTFYNRPGWLIRMASSYSRHGAAQYGAMGSGAELGANVWAHIRTTAFWMPPHLMNEYPKRVVSPADRHPFEHGRDCFTEWIKKRGLLSWEVTWQRELLVREWGSDPNGFHRGNQSSLLAGDRMCEPPYYSSR